MQAGRRPGRTVATADGTDAISSRALLLRSAADLMIERGSIDVSLTDIALRSQRNTALVRYYFGSKTGMMIALVEEILGQEVQNLTTLVKIDLCPVEKLRIHIRGVVDVYCRHPFINRLLHSLLMEKDSALQVSEAISKPLAVIQGELIQQGIDQGLFKPFDPMMLYFIILGSCEHIFFGKHVLKHAFDVQDISDDLRLRYTATVMDLLLGGILTQAHASAMAGRSRQTG